MNRVTGTYESGKVILDRPVNWRNGTLVIVEPGQFGSDTCVDGSNGKMIRRRYNNGGAKTGSRESNHSIQKKRSNSLPPCAKPVSSKSAYYPRGRRG